MPSCGVDVSSLPTRLRHLPARHNDGHRLSAAVPKVEVAIAPQEEREGGGQPIRTRRFLSPRVQGEFSVRRNRNHAHIVQTKVGVLSLPRTRKC